MAFTRIAALALPALLCLAGPPPAAAKQTPTTPAQKLLNPSGGNLLNPTGKDLLNPSGKDLRNPEGKDIRNPDGIDLMAPPLPDWEHLTVDGTTLEQLTPEQKTALRRYCRQYPDAITAHTPDEDVTYKPNVDIHGNPIAPVDATPTLPMGRLDIPITLPVTSYMKNPDAYNVDLSDTRIQAGTLSIEPDGHVLWNGEALPDANNPYAALCGELAKVSDK